jgi:hypothetical protein
MPSSPDIESNAEEKEQIKNHLIDSWRKILYLHYSHYNRIDQKSQRFLAFMWAVEGYFIIHFFLNRKFDALDLGSGIMIVALCIGAIILGIYISILQSKPFYNWPNISEQASDFRPNGKIEDVRKDTLATLKISYEENIKIINKKAKLFKISIRWICLYFITLVFYFIELKMNESQIPSDILWTQEVIVNELPLPEEDTLTTDHVGAVEDNPAHIEKIEDENNEENELPKDEEEPQPIITKDEELNSDNVGVSETNHLPWEE